MMLTAGNIIAAIGVAGGGIGFCVGLYRYHVGQKWKKSEFAAKLLDELANDERLSTCCKLLDYSVRKFQVPHQYLQLTEDTIFLHDWDAMTRALAYEADIGMFSWQEVLYRDLFDYFFGYLERVNHYIEIDLITVHDISSLKYWLIQISKPRFSNTPIFTDFIKNYEYSSILRLMEQFEIQY